MTDTLPAALMAEFRKLNEAQVMTLLGEIVDPSIGTPFDLSDEIMDALAPVSKGYGAAFRGIRFVLEAE